MIIPVYWNLTEAAHAPLHTPETWLGAGEFQQLEGLRFLKRRREWLLGRFTAKQLILSSLGLASFRDIEIRNAPGGAPQVWIDGGLRSDLCLTISHSGVHAFCALTTVQGQRIGADMERVETRSELFIQDYFTLREIKWINSLDEQRTAFGASLLWSVKEAMLKSLQTGLGMDTRRVEVRTVGEAGQGDVWNSADVSARGLAWRAWWRQEGEYVLTLAAILAGGEAQEEIFLKRMKG